MNAGVAAAAPKKKASRFDDTDDEGDKAPAVSGKNKKLLAAQQAAEERKKLLARIEEQVTAYITGYFLYEKDETTPDKLNPFTFYEWLETTFHDKCSDILSLAQGTMAMQATSAAIERAFSAGKRVVTPERLSLTSERIRRLTLVYIRFRQGLRKPLVAMPALPAWKRGSFPPPAAGNGWFHLRGAATGVAPPADGEVWVAENQREENLSESDIAADVADLDKVAQLTTGAQK